MHEAYSQAGGPRGFTYGIRIRRRRDRCAFSAPRSRRAIWIARQMIAVRDIGVFASLVFFSRETYIGNNLEISGNELTLTEAVEAIHRIFGVPVHYEVPSKPRQIDSDEHDGVKATAFFDKEGYLADLSVLRQMHPELLDFPSWLEQLKHGKS